jgi:Protein of unknown function (DUF2934)
MIDPKTHMQPIPKATARPNSPDKVAMMPNSVPLQDRIRERAYELYESRGREPGQDEQDWFRAEQELHGQVSKR